jgi:hypothetical protein
MANCKLTYVIIITISWTKKSDSRSSLFQTATAHPVDNDVFVVDTPPFTYFVLQGGLIYLLPLEVHDFLTPAAYEMVVPNANCFISGLTFRRVHLADKTVVFEGSHGAVDGVKGDCRHCLSQARIQHFRSWMVIRLCEFAL